MIKVSRPFGEKITEGRHKTRKPPVKGLWVALVN